MTCATVRRWGFHVQTLSAAAPATAVITANLLSFLIYTVAVLWAFATRSATRAWVGILAPALLLAALAWLGGAENPL